MKVRTIRRRTLCIALTLLILMGGSWWGTRPGIDPRLVGAWQLDMSSSGLVGFELGADGSAETASNLQIVDDEAQTLPLPWNVQGDVLLISQQRNRYRGLGDRLELELRSAWEKLVSPATAYSRWRIVELTENSLTVEPLDNDPLNGPPGTVSRYHRLPKGAKINTHPMAFQDSW